MVPNAMPNAIMQLHADFQDIFEELQASCRGKDGPNPDFTLLHTFGRKYLVALYACSEELEMEQEEETAMDEMKTLIKWACCIWELAVIMFVAQPTVLTHHIQRWWGMHFSSGKEKEEMDEICASENPAVQVVCNPHACSHIGLAMSSHSSYLQPNFWPTLRRLIAHGSIEAALTLLQHHNTSGVGETDELENLMAKLEALVEVAPRLASPELFKVGRRLWCG